MLKFLELIGLTLLPFLELRASIPYGVFNTDYSLTTIFLICTLTNIALAPILYLFLNKFVHIFQRVSLFDKYYQKFVLKSQKKVKKYVDKYGVIGLALFIGVPLPGSGVYSGALGAYILGFKFKDFLYAAIIGVFIAGVIVLLVSTLGNGVLGFMLKRI